MRRHINAIPGLVLLDIVIWMKKKFSISRIIEKIANQRNFNTEARGYCCICKQTGNTKSPQKKAKNEKRTRHENITISEIIGRI